MKKLAILLALVLAFAYVTGAIAEDIPTEEEDIIAEVQVEDEIISASQIEDEIISASQIEDEIQSVEETLDGEEQDEQAEQKAAAEYTFIFVVGEEVVFTQTVAIDEALIPPEAPQAPEGKVFAGWYIGEMRLSEELPEILNEAMAADGSTDEVCVTAIFADEKAEEDTAEEVSTEEEPAEEKAVEDTAEVVSTEEEPTEEEPALVGSVKGPSEQDVVEQEETDETGQIEQTESFEELEAPILPVALDLSYTGEMQALVSGPDDGTVIYSLDGETFSTEIPTAINAGEYTVYYKFSTEGDEETAEAIVSLAVTIAKADVILIPPTALYTFEQS